jgi:hypothetical protein
MAWAPGETWRQSHRDAKWQPNVIVPDHTAFISYNSVDVENAQPKAMPNRWGLASDGPLWRIAKGSNHTLPSGLCLQDLIEAPIVYRLLIDTVLRP